VARAVAAAISGGKWSTAALSGSTEAAQFHDDAAQARRGMTRRRRTGGMTMGWCTITIGP
jgi:hypothetical protein